MIIIVILILGFKPFATAADPLKEDCRTSNDYPVMGPYEQNLDLLSAALRRNASSTPTTHFAKGSVGAYPSTAYGLALCRGDNASASACGDCVATAFQHAFLGQCGHNKEAHLLYETCVLHFSNQDFISYRANNVRSNLLIVPEPPLPGWDPSDAKSVDTINGIVEVLLNETARQTAYNSTTARYATILMDGNDAGFPPLYSLAQCAPDLPPSDCWDCLWSIYSDTRTSFSVRQGGRIAGIWCDFRYSTHQFYQGQPMRRIATPDAVVRTTKPPPPPPRPALVVPNQHKRRPVKVLVIATVVPLLALFFCFIFCFWLIRRHRKGKLSIHEDELALVWGTEGSSEFKFFNFSQVSDATSNFSDENKLGQGGFGPVYKGHLPDGLEIAVKRLASHSGQGFTEFKNEVQLIAKLQHTNLVRLLGCCSQGEEKILIYEYLPNKSLDFFIFDETRRALLNWNNRLAIIEGIAQGLLYLHKHSRPRVIHRDLKASNILLDSEMKPKISDFGLAKIFNPNDTEGNTKRIAGTYGYMAPEYASEGIFSVKSDVFSFGVLTLEIISGTRNSGFYQHGNSFNLLGYAWKLWREGRWLELIDGPLVLEIDALERMRCVNIALLCVQENAADRPTMSDVIAMLSSDSMTLLDPKHPAYFHVTVAKDGGSTAAAEPSTVNDVTISILDGR